MKSKTLALAIAAVLAVGSIGVAVSAPVSQSSESWPYAVAQYVECELGSTDACTAFFNGFGQYHIDPQIQNRGKYN